MVHVFYTRFSKQLPAAIWTHWFDLLTPAMQSQIGRYRNWQDAQRSLLGKALLIWGCRKLQLSKISLYNLEVGNFQKPFFNSGPGFNISHSGNVVVCAISDSNNIGIDIEEVKPVPLADFSDLFSKTEMQSIFRLETDFEPFYTLWTQKEAFLKAIGTGLHFPLKDVEVANGQILYNGHPYYLKQVAVASGYICNIAIDDVDQVLSVEEVTFD